MGTLTVRKYDKYKDSGNNWLGEIPAHWEVMRVKDEFINLDYKRIPLSGEIREQMTVGIYDYYGASGVIDKVDNYIFDEPLILIGEDGANLLTRNSPLAFIARGKYWVNNHAHILKPKKGNLEYFCYLLESFDYTTLISGSAQPKLTAARLQSVPLMVPPVQEQKAIADYLDTKTGQISRKIELLTEKAKHYRSLKQALINDVVTKGLDKNVKMKNSEIDWIGYVPKHWDIKRLKELGYLYSGLSSKSGEDFSDEHEFSKDYIPFVNVANNKYISPDNMQKVVVYPQEKQNKVKRNDLFFLMSSENYEDIGKSALLKIEMEDTYLNSFCKGFRFTNKDICANFINYLLLSEKYRNSISVEGKGFTRINLKIEKINNLLLVIPPISEQKAIANYLDTKTEHIDRIVETINIQIEKLKVLRKTLINDVVTGKIKIVEAEEGGTAQYERITFTR